MADDSREIVEKAHRLVDELYEYRSNYFISNPVTDAPSQRDADVEQRLIETLEQLTAVTEGLRGREKGYTVSLLRGKALNVTERYSQEAFELLSKAVKLDPHHAEAWTQLGECYWKKGDISSALNCFQGALKYNKENIESLRNLSIALRQVGQSPEEQASNLAKSVEIANEAVKLNINDGYSWSVLGNAYMIMFFRSASLNVSLLQRCKQAYQRVMLDKKAANQPDFLYNYCSLMAYEENYQEVLDNLRKASLMDPTWSELTEWRTALIGFLSEIVTMIEKRASLKPKRLSAMLADLCLKGSGQRGPYSDEHAYSSKALEELSEGKNEKSVILVKVIGSVSCYKEVCKTIIAMDSKSNCLACSLYNVGNAPKIADTIAINDPVLTNVSIAVDSKVFAFASIRIDRPDLNVVNGRPFPRELLARPVANNVIRH